MADKKFKTGVDLQSTVKISSETAQRAMILDASGNLVSSAVTDTELGYVSGLTSAIQTQVDAKADLVGGKIPSAQLPAIAITEVFTAADITARDALTVGTGDGEIQEGDVVIVTDASADAGITSGAASYIYNGSSYSLLKAGDEVLSVNTQTGAVVLDADDISDAATTNKFVVAGDITKLGHISVTQAVDLDTIESNTATNNAKVSADGLVSTHSDVTSAGSGAIITTQERTDLGTALQPADSSTQLNHTQATPGDWTVADASSVGAHIDEVGGRLDTLENATGGNFSAGDILETSFAFVDNNITASIVTGLTFDESVVRSFDAQVSINRSGDSLYEVFKLTAIQKAAGTWDMSIEGVGDDSGIVFTLVVNTGVAEIRYTSSDLTAGGTMKFRADTTSI